MGGDAHAQYEGKHRVRYQPARIDVQPLTAAKLDIYQFYRKEFHEVLNVLIIMLGDKHRDSRTRELAASRDRGQQCKFKMVA